MKDSKWHELYKNDISRNGGYETYYNKKIKYRSKFVKKITKYATNKKVLEAGCGTGVISVNLAKKGFSSYAVDCDNGMLDLVKELSLSINSNVPNLVCEDIFNLHNRFKENEMDVVYSIGVYEHFSDADIKKLLESQLKISKYVFVGIPTKYFNDNEKLYGNERFLKLSYWRQILSSKDHKIIEEFSCHNNSFKKRILNYKKWGKPAPIYVFVISKL